MVVRRPQAWAAGPGGVLGSGRGAEEGRAIATLLDRTAEAGALAGRAGGGRGRAERGAGAAGRGRHRQDGAAGMGGRTGGRHAAGPGSRGRVGDGPGVRRAASARPIPFLDGLPGPQAREFGRDATVGEAVFVPSSPDSAEDDGYVMAFVHNPERGASDLVILAAQDFTGAPVATVHLPARIPLGFHGSWIPDR